MTDNRQLFTSKSDDYAKFRPSYPDAAVRWLKERTAAKRILDIGAGTGIFTRVLLKHFAEVSAVEPNSDMREKFRIALPETQCFNTTGEATGLPENSFDLITVAQAFHWLDAEKFKREAARILTPEGKVAIVWNTGLPDEFSSARNKVCRKYCPRFASGHAGKHSPAEGDIFLRERFFRKVEVVAFDNPFEMDLIAFEGNMRSRSYALTPEDERYNDFMSELRSVFECYAVNGKVTELQETQIYLGSF